MPSPAYSAETLFYKNRFQFFECDPVTPGYQSDDKQKYQKYRVRINPRFSKESYSGEINSGMFP